MKLLLDACVLYPTVMREMLLAVARRGHFTPLWTRRILDEWARAARKLGPAGEAQAAAEIALLRAAWPAAELPPAPGIEARLWLPDPNDTHVLAAAIAGSAEAIVTLNAADFPRNILAEEGLDRLDPDSLLLSLWQSAPEDIAAAARDVLDRANRLSGDRWQLRPLLKKARLPRLGKALAE
ncbi:RSP_2648 family PIN domain-containing protein [Jhaorihella thermophila]|uniref:PIN domain-containing protein n=1 Tax=Jhaorihella thermophila TaxID=488547 RepID=A0A1H5WWW8_9RHOB|nr:PIN domain-containing protein [Jhaorihella thermophila]SEG03803.1 PIN domain-containing protein [Jhaorihella thermophila]